MLQRWPSSIAAMCQQSSEMSLFKVVRRVGESLGKGEDTKSLRSMSSTINIIGPLICAIIVEIIIIMWDNSSSEAKE